MLERKYKHKDKIKTDTRQTCGDECVRDVCLSEHAQYRASVERHRLASSTLRIHQHHHSPADTHTTELNT